MFRKLAIALVAASVFTAPVLAQGTLSGGTPSTPSSDTMDKTKTEKTEKSVESTEKSMKAATKPHHAARHHRHGSRMAKFGKPVKYGKAHTTTSKVVKTESRRHGKIFTKRAFGRAYKHTTSGMKPH